jgi:hypothetical protein
VHHGRLEDVEIYTIPGLIAEYTLDHGAHVAVDAVGSDDRDNVRRVLD